MKRKKEDGETEDQHRQIVAKPDDEALLNFLLECFHLSPNDAQPGRVKDGVDVMPDRVALRTCVLREDGREDYGPLIFGREYKPTVAPCPKLEELIALCNTLVQRAQHDCSQSGRRRLYTVQASNIGKGAEPFARHLLTMVPKSRELAIVMDEDTAPSSQKLLMSLLADSHRNSEAERRNARWAIEQAFHVMSGALESKDARIERMEALLDGTWERQSKLLSATEDALDRSAKRKQEADRAALKTAAIRDGIAMVKGLLPGITAAITRGKVGVQPAVASFMGSLTRRQLAALVGSESLAAPTDGGILTPAQADLLRRIDQGEATLVGELFSSLSAEQLDQLRGLLTEAQLLTISEVAAGLDEGAGNRAASGAAAARPGDAAVVAKLLDGLSDEDSLKLFGDWEQSDDGDGMRNVSPGVLSADQFFCLARVAKGRLPPAAIDELLPGGKLAITAEQTEQARAILPPAAVAQLMELFALRMRARQADGVH